MVSTPYSSFNRYCITSNWSLPTAAKSSLLLSQKHGGAEWPFIGELKDPLSNDSVCPHLSIEFGENFRLELREGFEIESTGEGWCLQLRIGLG